MVVHLQYSMSTQPSTFSWTVKWVPAKGRWRSAAGEVTAGLAESNSNLPPGGWLKSPAGWLPVNRDQLQAQRMVMSIGSICLLYEIQESWVIRVERFAMAPVVTYNKGCIHRIANPRKGCTSIVISMSVCLFLCLSLRISQERHVWSLPNLLSMLLMTVHRSCSGMVMTFLLHVHCSFCTRHGPNRPKQAVPSDIVSVADLMMPRLLIRLVQHLRDHNPRGKYHLLHRGFFTMLFHIHS